MKKYLLVLAVLLVGLAVVATPKHPKFPKITKAASKPQIGRERFCIMLSCISQAGNRNQVLDPANYTQTECPNVECDGVVCVCAIYAMRNAATGKPIINASTDATLYYQLLDFAADGDWDNSHSMVDLKNE